MNANAKELRDALKKRGMNIKKLCKLARVQYTAFSAVLSGKRGGRNTWPHVGLVLTESEKEIVERLYGDHVFGEPKLEA